MSKFLTSLVVEDIEGSSWKLKEPLLYHSSLLSKTIEIPIGFISDFASVPRLPVAWLLAGGIANNSATVHDFIYRTKPHICNRRKADLVFLEAMKVEKISLWRREMMYLAVRACGFRSWA